MFEAQVAYNYALREQSQNKLFGAEHLHPHSDLEPGHLGDSCKRGESRRECTGRDPLDKAGRSTLSHHSSGRWCHSNRRREQVEEKKTVVLKKTALHIS